MYPAAYRRPPTWWWFLIPALSLGFGAFVSVFIGATTLRSRPQVFAAGGYLLVNVAYFGIAALNPAGPGDGLLGEPSKVVSQMAYPFLAITWLLGTLHTLYLQWAASRTPMPVPADPAMAVAVHRAAIRAHARRLTETDPAMAWELKIGRPDLPGRQYDDGGLVDINHVPAGWIAYSLQIPPYLADRIVAARQRPGGFRFPEELMIHCPEMTPQHLAVIRDFLLFRPL